MFIDNLEVLNTRAKIILNMEENENITVAVRELGHRIYPDGKVEPFEREVEHKIPGYKYSSFSHHCGRYEFLDGRVFEEFIQMESITGAHLAFAYVALEDGFGNVVEESLWTSEEIAHQEAILALAP